MSPFENATRTLKHTHTNSCTDRLCVAHTHRCTHPESFDHLHRKCRREKGKSLKEREACRVDKPCPMNEVLDLTSEGEAWGDELG